jgi:hypothetical protein
MISKFDKTDAKRSVNKTFKPLTGFLNSIEAEFTMSLNISHRIYPCSDMCIEDEAANTTLGLRFVVRSIFSIITGCIIC